MSETGRIGLCERASCPLLEVDVGLDVGGSVTCGGRGAGGRLWKPGVKVDGEGNVDDEPVLLMLVRTLGRFEDGALGKPFESNLTRIPTE